MTAYYNENDPEKVVALRALMEAGWIAPGVIDNKDIRDVNPDELSRFTQCHFFAGIGLWSVAARAAGISDDTRFWSGSCPCQPFSAAGAGEGLVDDRHLWPHWFWLVAQQRPDALVGEQVASQDGLAWLDLVCADMERSDYAGGALDLCSAGFGAPNIRQRIYMLWLDDLIGDGWREGRDRDHARDERIVADANGGNGWMGDAAKEGYLSAPLAGADSGNEKQGPRDAGFERPSDARGLVDRERAGLERQRGDGDRGDQSGRVGTRAARSIAPPGTIGRMADGAPLGRGKEYPGAGGESAGNRAQGDAARFENGGPVGRLASADERGSQPGRLSARQGRPGEGAPLESRDGESGVDRDRAGREFRDQMPSATNGFWADADWLLCRDPDGPKLRPVESGTFCLAAGYPGRAGELRAYGDAINLRAATEFLKAIKAEGLI